MRCKFEYMRGRPASDCVLVDLSDSPEGGCILLDSEEPIYAAAPGQVCRVGGLSAQLFILIHLRGMTS